MRQDTSGLRGDIVVNGVRYPLDELKGKKVWKEGDALNLQAGDAGIPVSAEWPVGVPGGMGETKRTSRDSIGCALATLDTSNYGFWRLPPRRVTVTPTIAPTDDNTFGFEEAASGYIATDISKADLTSGSATAAATAVSATELTSGTGGGGGGSLIVSNPLVSYTSHSSASSYATGSFTPTANRLILASVSNRLGTGTATLPTLSGNSCDWTQVATQTRGINRITVFRSLDAAPSAGALTADFGGVSQSECEIQVTEFLNVDTGGTNGADAVVQSASNSATATSLTVTLSTFGSSSNATFAAFWGRAGTGTDLTHGAIMTELYESTNVDGFGTLYTEWWSLARINPSCENFDGLSTTFVGIAIEIKQATSSAAEFATAEITPSANKLVLVAVYSTLASGSAGPSGLTGNGCTWVKLTSEQVFGTDHRLTVWRTLNASPTTGSITITFAAAQSICRWSVVEFGDVDTGGTNGSAAVVQDVADTSAAATSLSVTLAAFGDAANATYGAFANTDTVGTTPGTGFTELDEEINSGTLQTEWKNSNDTGVDASTTASVAWGGVAVEIKFATAATYTTASITPTANRLVLLAVHNNSATADTCTVTGCGMSWASEATVTVSTGRLTIFSSMSAAPTTGVLTISFGGVSQTAVRWSVVEFAGVASTSAAAVLQPTTDSSASATTLTVTLAAFAASTNATFSAFATEDTAGMTAGTGFTEIHDVAANSFELQTEWLNGTDTTVNSTKTGDAAAYLGIALEIQAGSQSVPWGGTRFAYLVQGEYVSKLSVSSNAITVQEQTHLGDGAEAGHPAKFGISTLDPRWYVPAGPDQPFWTLDAVTETTGDTWTQDAQGNLALAFTVTNQGANAVLLRAHSRYFVDISADGESWSGDDYAVGDISTKITSMIDSGQMVFVAKEHGLYSFDTSGVANELTRYQVGDNDPTYGAGLMVPSGSNAAFYNHKALHLYDGDRARMTGLDASPVNKSIPNISYEPHRGSHMELLYASDDWIYATYKVTESSTTKTYLIAYQRSGSQWIPHGFDRFDGIAHIFLIDSEKRLWFTDNANAKIGYYILGADGSPDAGRDSIGYGAASTTYSLVYSREDFGFPHTLKQLRAVEVKAWNNGATTPIQVKVYRDGGTGENVGATITSGVVNKRYWNSADSGTTLTTALTQTATSVVYTGTDVFSVNDIAVIDDERMLVTAIDTGTNTLTVTRGYFGTAAVEHNVAGTAIYREYDTCYDAQFEISIATTAGYTNTVADGSELRGLNFRADGHLRPDRARRVTFVVDTSRDYAHGTPDARKPIHDPKTMRDFLKDLENGHPVACIDPDGNTLNLFVTKVGDAEPQAVNPANYTIIVEGITWISS